MVSIAERGLGSVLADNPDLFRHTFRRGELYNAASSSRGVQCQLLATTVTSTEQLQQQLQQQSSSSSQLHWAYGPAIYQHLRDVRAIPLSLQTPFLLAKQISGVFTGSLLELCKIVQNLCIG